MNPLFPERGHQLSLHNSLPPSLFVHQAFLWALLMKCKCTRCLKQSGPQEWSSTSSPLMSLSPRQARPPAFVPCRHPVSHVHLADLSPNFRGRHFFRLITKGVSDSPLRQMLTLFRQVFQDAYGRCLLDVFKDPWWTNFTALRWAKEVILPQRVRSDVLWQLMFSLPSSAMNNLSKSILKFWTTQIQNKLLTWASPT